MGNRADSTNTQIVTSEELEKGEILSLTSFWANWWPSKFLSSIITCIIAKLSPSPSAGKTVLFKIRDLTNWGETWKLLIDTAQRSLTSGGEIGLLDNLKFIVVDLSIAGTEKDY